MAFNKLFHRAIRRFRKVFNNQRYQALADPDKVLMIDPKIIEYSLPIGLPDWYLGIVCGGNWDLIRTKFTDKIVYRLYQKYFHDEENLTTTEIFQWWTARLEKYGIVHNCTSIEELQVHVQTKRALYESIRRYGILEPEQLAEKQRTDRKDDYIRVNIDRQGEFIFGPGGTNRLAIAKLLNIKSIPVKVCARHVQWQKVREETYRLYHQYHKRASSGKILHPDIFKLTHPDLEDLMPKK